MGKRYAGDVLMTVAVLLRSRMMGNYQVRFWRAVEGVTPSLTLLPNCNTLVKKSLSTRTHICTCGCRLDRDHNAAKNILNRALGTAGHVGTWILDPNASEDLSSTFVGEILHQQDRSLIEESPHL
jgi:putative transposase